MKPIILLFITVLIITACALWTERDAIRRAYIQAQAYQTDCLLPEGCK